MLWLEILWRVVNDYLPMSSLVNLVYANKHKDDRTTNRIPREARVAFNSSASAIFEYGSLQAQIIYIKNMSVINNSDQAYGDVF